VTKAGAGLMIVSGNNNYTGTTTVNAGTLQAGRTVNAFGSNSAVVLANTAGVVFDLNGFDNTIGSLATGGTTGGNVTLGSAILTMGGNNTSTSYAGAISGTGGLTKVGTGTQTLTGLNTYTGATTVNGGTLVVDTTTNATVLNSSSGLAVGGGTFQLKGKAATARTQILNGLTVNVGNSVVDVNNLGTSTTLDLSGVSGTAGITHVAGGTVDFRATTGTFGTTAIVKTGQANDSTGMLGTWATVNGGADFAANNGSGIIVAYTGYTALDAQAGGSNPVLNDGTTLNYRINAAGVSGAIALGAATTNINSLSQNISTASTIDTSSGTLRVGTVGGFLITPTGADLTIGTSAGSGIVTAGGNATDVAGELVLTNNSANTLTINSNVTDNGTGLVSVTKSGSGLATLAGTNTFTGGVTINAGVLQLNSAGALNATSSNAVTFGASSTGTLRLNGNSVTVLGLDTNAIAGTPVVENASATGATLTVSKASGTSTYAGVMRDGTGGGALSLTKSGAGTLVVTGANTYTGTTTVTAGTLRAGVGSVANVSGAFGNNSAVILANTAGVVLDLASFSTQLGSLSGGGTTGGNITLGSGTLTIGGDNTSPAAYAGVISGTGELVKIGTGTLILSGANTYTGAQSGNTRNTTIKAGTLVVGANAPSGSAGALGNSTTAVLLGDTTGSQNAALLTNGAFTIGKGINVQAGNTGLISLGGNQTSGTSTYSAGVALNKDTTLTAAAGGQVDFNGIVSGASNVTVDGGGTVKLAGVNTFGGAAKAITIQNGTTLQVGADNNLGNASNGLVFNNGTLKFGAAFDPTARTTTFNSGGASFDTNGLTLSFANAVGNSGTGGLKKLGAGTLNLNAVNTYTGDTIISAGTLALGASGAINANSAITVAAGATFDTTAQSYTFSTAKTTTISVGATSAGLINSAALTFSSAKLGFDFGSTTTLLASYTVLVKSGFTGNFSEVNATGTSISGSFLDAGSGNWTLTSGGYDITFSQSSGMLTAVVSSVPEPATYAALFGTLVLAGAVWQRRRSVRR
ncbi:MAG TPA: autotransporter-associated beta strand repeat-containing protein, partial [Roseimicrobium sp.]|nr:autotransporter-associated beta strand repeat-containing protein [Roseimicrobium sp.]